jgi:hypothetical protein
VGSSRPDRCPTAVVAVCGGMHHFRAGAISGAARFGYPAIMQVTARISPMGALIRITDPAKFLSQMNQLAKAPLAELAAMEIQAIALVSAEGEDLR